jgi:hypothetical protein
MNIPGISAFYPDAAAAVLRDGEIVEKNSPAISCEAS